PIVRFGAAIERVHHAELFRHLAGAAELADDLAGQPHLVDLAVLHALGLVRVGRVEVLRRAARYANRLRCADGGDLRLERPFAVEHLDALVAGVGDVEIARRIRGDAADVIELPLAGSGLSPRLHEVALLRELTDPMVGPEAVGDVDVAGAIPRDVGRPIEAVAVDSGARRAASAAASAALTAAAAAGPRCPFRRHAAAGRHAGPGPHADVLRLAAEHELEPPVAVELHHLVRSGVDDPDVVLRIDAHLLREVDRVDALADLLDELAVLIELKQARA